MTCYRQGGRKLTMNKSHCNECQEVRSYKVCADDTWECLSCGFAIECVECGLTMTAGHDCPANRPLHEDGSRCLHDCDECHDQGIVFIPFGHTACPQCARRVA